MVKEKEQEQKIPETAGLVMIQESNAAYGS
jgi:hypothetical protein